MTSQPRQTPGTAIHPSRGGPITWAAVGRTLAGATLVGAFLAIIGAFGTFEAPLWLRLAYTLPMSWAGAALGLFFYRVVTRRLPGLDGRPWLQGVVSATLMSPFMTILAWGFVWLVEGRAQSPGHLPSTFVITFISCQAFTAVSVSLNRQAYLTGLTLAGEAPAPPKFLERLPLKLRGAEIWAVEAEDHYLRLHTSKGQDLILLRLADAIGELEGIEGAQVHRSWWVSRAAIADARRGDGRAVLTLRDGSEVPVSRTYARLLREQGWI